MFEITRFCFCVVFIKYLLCLENEGSSTGNEISDVDDDECTLGTHNCRLLGTDWECRNTFGSFRCEKKPCQNPLNCIRTTHANCPKGFELHNKGTCVDVNECNQKSTCPGQNCINTVGSFRCFTHLACSDGFRLDSTSTHCIDINECEEQPGLCDNHCINTYGSFKCACNSGFVLLHDNRSCVDVNECELYKNRRLCVGYCVNEPGTYKCECPEGYSLGVDRASCLDIDECVTENKCNGPSEVCLNMQGSYRCNSIVCPINYIKDADKKNRCIRAPYYCTTYSEECLKMPLSYSYSYITFVSNTPIPVSGRLELFYMRGPTSGTSSIEFVLELKSVLAPLGVPKVTRDYFYLNRVSSNQVTVSLVQSVSGPQDIELNLQMNVSNRGISSGFTVSKLFIFVSKYEF